MRIAALCLLGLASLQVPSALAASADYAGNGELLDRLAVERFEAGASVHLFRAHQVNYTAERHDLLAGTRGADGSCRHVSTGQVPAALLGSSRYLVEENVA